MIINLLNDDSFYHEIRKKSMNVQSSQNDDRRSRGLSPCEKMMDELKNQNLFDKSDSKRFRSPQPVPYRRKKDIKHSLTRISNYFRNSFLPQSKI